ncbi:MAG TPA: nucleoside 2-deoxyribosyltransferase [Caulobacteraceae bacterium]|nr:nucleoside 2-deoxyribosyltransferase [Caulobacteraceae bacterium]
MRRIASLYIGGPDAAMPEGANRLTEKRMLCQDRGFAPVLSTDGVLVETEPSEAMAREMYADRVQRLRQADAAILNFTPWRGPGCYSGAAFEAGFLAALGKPVFAYLNVETEDEAELKTRIGHSMGLELDRKGVVRDGFGGEVEDFGLPEDLMLWAEARRLFVIVTADVWNDLTGFELCLDAVKLYSD